MPGEIIYQPPLAVDLVPEGSGPNVDLRPPADVTDITANVGPRSGFSKTPEGQAVESAWDKFRSVIDEDFYNLEQAFELIGSSTLDAGTGIALTETAAGAEVTIEALPFVALSAAILAGEYAFGWLIKKVGQLFPNPSILGWHPLGFIQHGLINMGNGFEGSARGLGGDIIGVFRTPVHQILGMLERVGNALVGAHNKSRTIVKERIPAAVDESVAKATVYADASVATLQGDQAAALARLAQDTADAIQAGKIDAASATTKTLETLQAGIMERVADDQTTLDAIESALSTQLPLQVAADVAAAEASQNAALIAAALVLAESITNLAGQVTSHQSAISSLESQIRAAEALIEGATGTDPATQAAIKYQEGLIVTYQSDILTNVKAIEGLESQITAKSTTLGQIHTVQQLRTTQNTSNEVVAVAALATVVATVAKAVYSLKTKVDQCMVDRCNPSGPHGLKTELLALLALLTDAGELAFIAEAVRDPLGTADTLAPGLDAIDAAAVSTLDALLSL